MITNYLVAGAPKNRGVGWEGSCCLLKTTSPYTASLLSRDPASTGFARCELRARCDFGGPGLQRSVIFSHGSHRVPIQWTARTAFGDSRETEPSTGSNRRENPNPYLTLSVISYLNKSRLGRNMASDRRYLSRLMPQVVKLNEGISPSFAYAMSRSCKK